MVKLKRSPKNLELDVSVAKTGNSTVFRGKQQIPRQMSNSTARLENPRAMEYCWPCSWISSCNCTCLSHQTFDSRRCLRDVANNVNDNEENDGRIFLCVDVDKVLEQVETFGIQLYPLPECDDDEDADYKEQCRQLKVIWMSLLLITHCTYWLSNVISII